MKAPQMGVLNWSAWGMAVLCVAAAFYLTLTGEKILSTVLFLLGYVVFPVFGILLKGKGNGGNAESSGNL